LHTKGHIKSPAGIRKSFADKQRNDGEQSADHKKVPAEKIETREKYIVGPELYRQEEIAENSRDAGNNKKKDHYYPMQGKGRVIGLGTHNSPTLSHQLSSHQETKKHGEYEPE